MPASAIEKSQYQLIPPSLLFSPIVKNDGSFQLRTDPRYRHENSLANYGLNKEAIKTDLAKHDEKGDFFPLFLQEWYQSEIGHLETVLADAHNELIKKDKITSRQENFRLPWTRKLVLDLFPQLKKVVDLGYEQQLFKGKSVEDFIDDVSLPLARGFPVWCRDFMPDSLKPSLYPFPEISNSIYLMDLVRLYSGGTVVLAPIPEEPEGELFNIYLNRQLINMLQLVYVATLSEITKSPHEEIIRDAFDDAVSSFLPKTGSINLAVNLDSKGKVQQMNILDVSAPIGQNDPKGKKWKNAYKLIQTYPVRRFSEKQEGVASLIEREKDKYARMFKIMRGRFPLSDSLGARFILYDLATLDDFESKLSRAMPDWVIKREPGETVSPQSNWQEGIKYKVCWKQFPDDEFELGIYWLKNTSKEKQENKNDKNGSKTVQGTFGNWAQNLFGYEENFPRYRIRQLLDHVLPILFPVNDCNIDWTSNDVKKILFDHAYNKAQASALVDFPD